MDPADVATTRLARRQLGLVTRAQALAAGMSPDQVKRRLSAGIFVASQRGVYRLGGGPPTFEQQLLAACLSAAGRAVASHRGAAALWHLRGVKPEILEITVPGEAKPWLRGVAVHRSVCLDRADVTRIGPVPVTRPARTLLDLAAVAPELAEGALDDALVRELVTLGGLTRLLDRVGASGRAGTAALRELVARRVGGQGPTESPLEDAIVGVLRAHGVPEPERQHRIRFRDGSTVRVDLAYPELRLGIEADGRIWHSGREDFLRDRARANRLAAVGWTLLRYGWADVRRGQALAAEVSRLRQALARAEGA